MDARYSSPGSVVFCAAFAIAAALYAQRILATWAERTESDLLVFCLADESSGVEPRTLIGDLRKEDLVRETRVVGQKELASWVQAAMQDTETSVAMSSAKSFPVVVELKCRGAVRNARRFDEMIAALKKKPDLDRVLFDSAGQQRVASFYSSARWVVLAWLVMAFTGSLVAGVGATANQAGPTSSRLSVVGLTLGRSQTDQDRLQLSLLPFLRRQVPSVVGWFCPFVMLLLWPLPSPEGLSVGAHLLVLAATVVLIELSRWLVGIASRFLA